MTNNTVKARDFPANYLRHHVRPQLGEPRDVAAMVTSLAADSARGQM